MCWCCERHREVTKKLVEEASYLDESKLRHKVYDNQNYKVQSGEFEGPSKVVTNVGHVKNPG